MAIIKKQRQVWQRCRPCTLLVGIQNDAVAMDHSIEIPQELKIEVPYDPAIPLLGIYPKEVKWGSPRDTGLPYSLQYYSQ